MHRYPTTRQHPAGLGAARVPGFLPCVTPTGSWSMNAAFGIAVDHKHPPRRHRVTSQ